MGFYRIEIEGMGAHHGTDPWNADYLAKEFVKNLKSMGHTITRAVFELKGQEDDINVPHQTLTETPGPVAQP